MAMQDTTPVRYELVIRNGTVVDGTGAARFAADVAIAGDTITAIGNLPQGAGEVEIDASGCVVAPGFIDAHTHDDRALLADPTSAPKVSQGVTTVVCGNCGVSVAPLQLDGPPPSPLDLVVDTESCQYPTFAAYLDDLHQSPAALNAACLVGHTTLRAGVMDALDRPATPAEIDKMRGLLGDALAAGAIGLSSGLFYPPAHAAPTAEVSALVQELSPVGGIYTAHIRDESDAVVKALEEAFEIGRGAGVRTIISHHKCAGRQNFGRTKETLALIEQARKRQDIGLDVYPYTAGSSMLGLNPMTDEAERVIVTWSRAMPHYAGCDLDDVARDLGTSRREAGERLRPGGGIYFMMDEEDVRRVLSYPQAMIGSDGLPHDEHPHPRLWGTFTRVLGHYARELGLFTVEEAVRRMTSLPATRFGLAGRGVVAAGAYADIVVFDPATVIDRATFDDPKRPSEGIKAVLVNGRLVWRDGASTGERPGQVLTAREAGSPAGAT
ncbi:MAG: amidohydrolase family protein [Kiloniellales bacterium]